MRRYRRRGRGRRGGGGASTGRGAALSAVRGWKLEAVRQEEWGGAAAECVGLRRQLALACSMGGGCRTLAQFDGALVRWLVVFVVGFRPARSE